MIKINLLPVRAAQKKESIRQQASILFFILLALFAGIGYAHISMKNKISDVKTKIVSVNAEIEQLKKKTGEVDDFKKKKRELLEKLNVIESLSKNKTGPVVILDSFSEMVPEKMWFEAINQNGAQLDIEGVALDNETIAGFFSLLKRSAFFKKVELVQTQQKDVDGLKLTSFRLTCDVDLSGTKPN